MMYKAILIPVAVFEENKVEFCMSPRVSLLSFILPSLWAFFFFFFFSIEEEDSERPVFLNKTLTDWMHSA